METAHAFASSFLIKLLIVTGPLTRQALDCASGSSRCSMTRNSKAGSALMTRSNGDRSGILNRLMSLWRSQAALEPPPVIPAPLSCSQISCLRSRHRFAELGCGNGRMRGSGDACRMRRQSIIVSFIRLFALCRGARLAQGSDHTMNSIAGIRSKNLARQVGPHSFRGGRSLPTAFRPKQEPIGRMATRETS